MPLCLLHTAPPVSNISSRAVCTFRNKKSILLRTPRLAAKLNERSCRPCMAQIQNRGNPAESTDGPIQSNTANLLPASEGQTIRQASQADVAGIALLCSEVFGPMTFKGFPSIMRASGKLQQQAKFEIQKDVDTQLGRAIDAKAKAQLEAREYRLRRKNSAMQAELQRLSGLAFSLPDAPSALQRQAFKRWQRNRHFICLIAIDRTSEEAAGCAVLSMAAPEAFLPPPFPSRAPLRCCISNLAVSEKLRRRGVAKKLLRRCETIAQRWGYGELWLHADASNGVAVQLYKSSGFEEVKRDPSLFGPFRRILFRKILGPKRGIEDSNSELLPSSSNKGTYLWDVTSK